MIRTIYRASLSSLRLTRVCCKDTADRTSRPSAIQEDRNDPYSEKGRSPIMKIARLLIIAVLTLSAIPLAAHDMWIEPTSFLPDAGSVVGLRLRIGQDFLGDPLPRDPALIDQFITVDATGRKPVYGHDGGDPAGLIRVTEPGVVIAGYQSHPAPIVIPAPTFNQYIKDEGLDAIAQLRAGRNQTNSEAREIFARCAKSLVRYGTPTNTQGDRTLGFTLELVAQKNPYTLRAGEDFPVDLTYEGRPLSNALVIAMNRANPMAKLTARTDAKGHVNFRLPQDGTWLIKAVHMIPAPAGTNAEWESFWASLTFQLKTSTTGVAAK
jgi:uncharacterized GH25 family protein